MGVLTEGATQTTPATKANLDAWISGLGVPFTWTLDSVTPQDTLEDWYGEPRDSFILIDLKTMKVVEIASDHVKALTDLQALLAM
jgi:hypothetical protein